MPPPWAGSRATDSDGNGNGPNRARQLGDRAHEFGHQLVAQLAVGGADAQAHAVDDCVRDRERADGHADVAGGAIVRVPGPGRRWMAGGSAGSPDMITVSAAGAVTVRSVSIASLVALSAVNWIMSSVCQPKPRSQASSGCADPNQA